MIKGTSGVQRAVWETEEQERERERLVRRGRRRVEITEVVRLELQNYPEKGRATPLARIRAGLNLSLMSSTPEDHADLCAALGVPAEVSEQCAWVRPDPVDLPRAA